MRLRFAAWLPVLLFAASCLSQDLPTPFTLEYGRMSFDAATGTRKAYDAKVTWGVCTLAAAEVTERNGVLDARGNVLYTDPLGVLTAAEMHYDTNTDSGWARNVAATGSGAMFTAERLELMPHKSEWVALNGLATVCDHKPPDFDIRFGRLSVRPGNRVRIWRTKLDLFGRHFLDLPTASMNISTGASIIPVTSFGYNRSTGVALGLREWIGLAPQLQFSAYATIFQRAKPVTSGLLSYSIARPGKTPVVDTPDSEEAERYAHSYIDNVNVASPQDEDALLLARRCLVFAESNSNVWAASRPDTSLYVSKDWGVGTQVNGRLGPLFGTVALRHGRLSESSEPGHTTRTALEGTVSVRSWQLGPKLAFRPRVDGASFWHAEHPHYGWVRVAAETVYDAAPYARFAFAAVRTLSDGTPTLLFDEPVHLRSLHARADLKLKSTHLSVLTKYDLDSRQLYDVEIRASTPLHCVEPYISWRKDLGELRFGITIPAFERLRELAVERGKVKGS